MFDKDYLSLDDQLGEVRLTLADLAAHDDDAKDYPLTTAEGAPAEGTVALMSGARVEEALVEEARGEIRDLRDISAGPIEVARGETRPPS